MAIQIYLPNSNISCYNVFCNNSSRSIRIGTTEGTRKRVYKVAVIKFHLTNCHSSGFMKRNRVCKNGMVLLRFSMAKCKKWKRWWWCYYFHNSHFSQSHYVGLLQACFYYLFLVLALQPKVSTSYVINLNSFSNCPYIQFKINYYWRYFI